MKKKITLTQEQVNEINRMGENDYDLDYFISRRINFGSDYDPLRLLSIDDIARVLYQPDSYEIKKRPFKANDWIVIHEGHSTAKVVQIEGIGTRRAWDNELCAIWDNDLRCLPFSKIRHATPKEIEEEQSKRWENYDRAIWELRRDDVLFFPELQDLLVFESLDEKGLVNLYSYSGKSQFKYTMNDIKTRFKVFCFAEDRLDIKDNVL